MLQRIWIWLFLGEATTKLWSKIPVRQSKPKSQTVTTVTKQTSIKQANKVVGGTKAVILSDPKSREVPIVASEDLEPTGYIGKDPEISPDDVDAPKFEQPSDDDLYDEPSGNEGYDPSMQSSGVTADELSQMVDVLRANGEVDGEQRLKANNTLLKVQGTAFMDVITNEVCSEALIANMLKDIESSEDEVIKGKVNKIEDVRIKEFDISMYDY